MTTSAGRAVNGDHEIEFESFGTASDPVMLLVNGFTSQLIRWPEPFCRMLVDAGFRVVRYDNRDVGLSTKTPDHLVPPADDLSAAPYSLSAMAADGVAVLDALGIESAHVAGRSMGGMIVQLMAIEHPDRVASMCSIMSTTGDRDVGGATDEAIEALRSPPPAERSAFVEHSVATGRVISGPLYDPDAAAELAGASFDRCFHPQGALCQLAAITTASDRTAALRTLDVPTLVIHGRLDPLIQLDGGESTAAAVPDATLVVFDEMGHDWPTPLWPAYVEQMTEVAGRAI